MDEVQIFGVMDTEKCFMLAAFDSHEGAENMIRGLGGRQNRYQVMPVPLHVGRTFIIRSNGKLSKQVVEGNRYFSRLREKLEQK